MQHIIDRKQHEKVHTGTPLASEKREKRLSKGLEACPAYRNLFRVYKSFYKLHGSDKNFRSLSTFQAELQRVLQNLVMR